jgi:Mn2+/Fe2+ NRAMP family transporter
MLPVLPTTLPADHTFLRGILMASSIRTHDPSSATGLSRPRRYAFTGYHWLLLAFLLAGCAQIFLAGLGVFSFGDHDAAGGASAFDAHRALGFTMAGAAVIIFALALIARPGAPPVALSGVLVVQTTLLQSLLAGLADNAALYGGLHALDGLLVLGIAGYLYATSRRRRA